MILDASTFKEFNWTDEPISGMLLIFAEHDSNGSDIKTQQYYFVGKHKITGMIAIVPSLPDFFNDFLKNKHRLN